MMLGERLILDNTDGADGFYGAEIIVVPIEDEAVYGSLLGAKDAAHISTLGSPRRRAESAAWRAAVRDRLGGNVSIKYNDVGAPEVSGGIFLGGAQCNAESKYGSGAQSIGGAECHIGVTHSDGFAAVIFSARHCAIDMESTERNFDRVANRFISPDEWALPESGHALFKCAVWCAKEALYKYSGRRELDLLRDIGITSTDIAGGKLSGTISNHDGNGAGTEAGKVNTEHKDDIKQEYSLNLIHFGGKYLIVYII